jgi:hypothetical protein
MTNREGKLIMSTWKTMLLAGAMAFTPMQAFAAPEEAPEAEIVAAPAVEGDEGHGMNDEAMAANAKAKMQKEIDAAIAMIEKIFGTDKLPPVAPAQLALARQTTAALIPAGSLEKMLDNLYGKLFKGLMGEFGGMSDISLSIKTGVESDKIAALDDKTKAAVADMFDPWRQQREDQITSIIKPQISEALHDLEAPMRDGMAHAYARKFSSDQLTQMNGFFATPAGTAFASEWMALQADPEVMLAMIKAVPPLVNKFIDRGPEIEGQFKDLPKEKQLADLSDAELAKLAKLMKVSVKELKDHRDQWDTPVEETTEATEAVDAAADAADAAAADADAAADAAQAAADAAEATVDDPAYNRDNWSEADRQRVEQLEEAANSASSAAFDAQEEAVANARKKTPST